jgi:hypothetical protein
MHSKTLSFSFLKARLRAFYIAIVCLSGMSQVVAQQGELGISAGPFLTFPTLDKGVGRGIEIGASYNFSNRSSILLLGQHSSVKRERENRAGAYDFTTGITSLFAGYRYQVTKSGAYAQAMVGPDWVGKIYTPRLSLDDLSDWSAVAGIGHRFSPHRSFKFDVGADYIHGYVRRFQIKACIISIAHRSERVAKSAGIE